jgi:ribosomal protein L5
MKILLYKSLFNRSFFFDKFYFKNNYQCPKISSVCLRVGSPVYLNSKFKFYKILILFYLLTGQKPKILIKIHTLRGVKKKKIVGLLLTLRKNISFFNFLVLRQLPLILFFQPFNVKFFTFNFSFSLIQKTHDDDILYQLLKISDNFKYQITLCTTAISTFQLQTLLLNFKIPCQMKLS